MRWRGLAKAGLQVRFTAVAYNIKRCSRILAAEALTDARNGRAASLHSRQLGAARLAATIKSHNAPNAPNHRRAQVS